MQPHYKTLGGGPHPPPSFMIHDLLSTIFITDVVGGHIQRNQCVRRRYPGRGESKLGSPHPRLRVRRDQILKPLLEASGSSFLILINYTAQLVNKEQIDLPPHLAS
jgi:hypothetical protein